jgi:hypothetical protein
MLKSMKYGMVSWSRNKEVVVFTRESIAKEDLPSAH